MNLVLDTSALSRLLGSDEKIIKAISAEPWERIIIPLAADGEIKFGFKYGDQEHKNFLVYEDFIDTFGIEIVCPDQNTSTLYAELAVWCRDKGISLSHNDLWIAACTMQNAAKLLTLDADFKRVLQVNLL